jgi:hypothetical protein
MGDQARAHEVPLLYQLGTAELERIAAVRRWPKWSTMCLLRRAGLPVLNACVIEPDQPRAALRTAIRTLAHATGTDRLMLRSDGGIETSAYYRGGHTFELAELLEPAWQLIQAGRAVILLEPTVRYTNRLAVLLRMDRPPHQPGTFTVEALGPGYDVADLTRGGILPQVTISIDNIDWSAYSSIWWSDMRVHRDLSTPAQAIRRRQRLQRLAGSVLPQAGPDTDPADVEQRLREAGHLGLFEDHDPTMTIVRRTKAWFADAALLAAAQPNRGWQCLATAYSLLGDGRAVYWDLVDGAAKYGTSRTAPRRRPTFKEDAA